MPRHETRHVAATLELREGDADNPAIQLVGYASTFDQPYQVGHFEETISRDAFKRTLASSPDVRLLVNHAGAPLARTKSGTLRLSTDERGLRVEADLDPSDPDVQALVPKMRRGDLDQMSFAFSVPRGGDEWDYSGSPVKRSVNEASLANGDVSVVTYPANGNATTALRSEDRPAANVEFLTSLIEARSADSDTEISAETLAQVVEALTELGLLAGPDERAAGDSLPYGDVEYADTVNHKYPIDTAEHVRAAWSYINVAKNREGYTAAELETIEGRIKAAAHKFGIEIAEQNSNADETEHATAPVLDMLAFARAKALQRSLR